MSFEQKRRHELEMDELKIKPHLNTSLEIEGISASEDLINRTLKAIRLQEAESSDAYKDKSENNKSIFVYRHARTLVTVVAAALLLVVGLNAIRMYTPLGMKKDMAESENSIEYDGSRTTEMYSTKDSAPKDNKLSNDMDAYEEFKFDAQAAGTIEEDEAQYNLEEDQYVDMLMGSDSGEVVNKNGETNGITSVEYTHSFADITSIEHSDVSSITITSKATEEMKTLTEKNQIDGFYSIMQNHVFMHGTGDITDTQYIVKITSEDADSQMVIGDTVVAVDNTNRDIISHSIYGTSDLDSLLKDLKDLMVD